MYLDKLPLELTFK